MLWGNGFPKAGQEKKEQIMYKFKSQYDELNLDLSSVDVRVSADDHEDFGQNQDGANEDNYSIHCEMLE